MWSKSYVKGLVLQSSKGLYGQIVHIAMHVHNQLLVIWNAKWLHTKNV